MPLRPLPSGARARPCTTPTLCAVQLLLIGDHQQLRPSVACYELSQKFGLTVSLFERACNNGAPLVRLRTQRRMRPTISRLIKPLYPELRDHPTTRGRPNVCGAAAWSTWPSGWGHSWPPTTGTTSRAASEGYWAALRHVDAFAAFGDAPGLGLHPKAIWLLSAESALRRVWPHT